MTAGPAKVVASAAVLAAVVASTVAGVPALGATRGRRAVRHAGPASQLIAFARQSGAAPPVIWATGARGGRARRIGPGGAPLVAPNGATIATATAAGATRTLLLYPTAGGQAVKVQLTARTQAYPVAWSPDSRYVAVALDSTAVTGLAGAGLAVIDTTTGAYTIVATGSVAGATFSADGSDTVIYGLSRSASFTAPVNLYESSPTSEVSTQLTHDGHSFNPVWTAHGIVFDHERLRGRAEAPIYQLWLLSGSQRNKLTRLTNLRVPPLLEGLVPLSASADGNRLLAEYEGEDTSYAWTVQLHPLRVHQLKVRGQGVQGAAISSDGASVLVDIGALMQPANRGIVESVQFSGRGPVRRLARGASPSWNL